MRLKISIALALLGALLFAPQASAHDLLVDINPVAGQVLTDGSFDAKLTFSNPLLVVAGISNAEIATRLSKSTEWTNHEVSISDRALTARVILTQPGDYSLRWRVVSSDGHPISGESTFTLEIAASVEKLPGSTPVTPTEANQEGGGSLVGFYIGLAMVVLGAIFAPIGLVIRRRAKRS